MSELKYESKEFSNHQTLTEADRMLTDAIAALADAEESIRDESTEHYPVSNFAEDNHSRIFGPLPASTEPLQSNRESPATGNDPAQEELILVYGSLRIAEEDLMDLDGGSLVLLEQSASEPVQVCVSGETVALGELIVLEGKVCIRISELRESIEGHTHP